VRADVVSILEGAYDVAPCTRDWLRLLIERSAPFLDRGLGQFASIWNVGQGADPTTVACHRMDDCQRDALLQAAVVSRSAHKQAASTMVLGTAMQRVGDDADAQADVHEMARRFLHPFGARDILFLKIADPGGRLIVAGVPAPDDSRPSRGEAMMWSRIAAHVAAGARLRAAASIHGVDRFDGVDAVLSPSGALHHVAPGAQDRGSREKLRQAARDVDRARTRAVRSDAKAALDLWQGLVAGRWSLVDRFDADGRRFLVARRNDPDVPDPRALTRRERQVLAYAAMGQPLKLIAYALGLSVSTIALYRGRAMRKLGLTSTAEVVRMFAQERARETVA
jgi:DNA-binding CsgD family transcriptional regulator